MFVQIGFQIFLGVFVYPLVCFRKGIVDYSVKGNIPIYQRFDREQRVVDAAQTPGRYQDNRQLLVGDVIDRQVSASNRNHQTSGSFEQNHVVPALEYSGGLCYFFYGNNTVVYLGCQMRRSGVGIDNGECDSLLILRGERYSHNFPMQVYVFGVAYIPGLYRFWSDRFNPFAVPFTRQPPCGITFPDFGIYTGDKKSSFHICVFLCAMM